MKEQYQSQNTSLRYIRLLVDIVDAKGGNGCTEDDG